MASQVEDIITQVKSLLLLAVRLLDYFLDYDRYNRKCIHKAILQSHDVPR